MATPKSQPSEPSRPKRRLKAPEQTVRQRQNSTALTANKPDGPLRRLTQLLGKPFRAFAGLSVWHAKAFKPLRVIGRLIGKILWPPYFRNSFAELKLVTWPDWKQSWRLTFAVLAFATVFGLAIAAVDYGLDTFFKDVIFK